MMHARVMRGTDVRAAPVKTVCTRATVNSQPPVLLRPGRLCAAEEDSDYEPSVAVGQKR